jgi:hypothetical protein
MYCCLFQFVVKLNTHNFILCKSVEQSPIINAYFLLHDEKFNGTEKKKLYIATATFKIQINLASKRCLRNEK